MTQIDTQTYILRGGPGDGQTVSVSKSDPPPYVTYMHVLPVAYMGNSKARPCRQPHYPGMCISKYECHVVISTVEPFLPKGFEYHYCDEE